MIKEQCRGGNSSGRQKLEYIEQKTMGCGRCTEVESEEVRKGLTRLQTIVHEVSFKPSLRTDDDRDCKN